MIKSVSRSQKGEVKLGAVKRVLGSVVRCVVVLPHWDTWDPKRWEGAYSSQAQVMVLHSLA